MFVLRKVLFYLFFLTSFLFIGNINCQKMYTDIDVENVFESISLVKNITILIGSPDGDAISAAAALSKVLVNQGKNVEVIHNGIIDPKLKFKPENLLVGLYNQKPDLLISLDEARKENLFWCEEFNGLPLIKVDHHDVVDRYGDVSLVDTGAAACCELLIDVFKIMNISSFTNDVAKILAFGILCDTQGGERGKLKNDAGKAISKLTELKLLKDEEVAELKRDYKKMMSFSTEEEIDFWNKIYETMNIQDELVYVFMSFDSVPECWHPVNTWTRSLKQFSELKVDGVRLRAFIYYVPEGKIWKDRKSGFNVSLRSAHDEASKIATSLKGGGRGSVGGFFVEGDEEEVFENVVLKIKDKLEKLD